MYLFYFDELQLPIAPSKLERKIKNQNKTVNLINDGEINFLKLPGLTDISFTCLLPNKEYPFAEYPDGYRDGNEYLNVFRELKEQHKVFKFRVLRRTRDRRAPPF